MGRRGRREESPPAAGPRAARGAEHRASLSLLREPCKAGRPRGPIPSHVSPPAETHALGSAPPPPPRRPSAPGYSDPRAAEAPVACAPRSRAGRSPSLDAPGSGSSPRTGAGAGRAGAGSEARLQGLVQVAAAVGVAVRVRACACACECVSKREREEGREEEERGGCVLAGDLEAPP